MKIMFAAPYIYDARYKEFSKTSSGFGYMVRDIMKEVSRENEVFLLTHQISGGYYDGYTAVRHRITDILKNIRIKFHYFIQKNNIRFLVQNIFRRKTGCRKHGNQYLAACMTGIQHYLKWDL